MKNEFYKNYLKDLPEGLVKLVAEVILDHRGQDNAIPRGTLVAMAASKFPDLRHIDRAVRIAIAKLRHDKWLIGMSHSGNGYFIVTSRDEYEKFKHEYTKRAYAVIENMRLMDKVADQVFRSEPQQAPGPKQLSLIG